MTAFSQFICERQYLSNVSPATLERYKHSFKWLRTESPPPARTLHAFRHGFAVNDCGKATL
jgi:hypothetical protein